MTITIDALRKMLRRLPDNAKLQIRTNDGEFLPRAEDFFLDHGHEFLLVDTTREKSDPALAKIEDMGLDVQYHGEGNGPGKQWRVSQSLNSPGTEGAPLLEGWGDTISQALTRLQHQEEKRDHK